MKTDALSMTMLFDCYGELLTEKQKTYFDSYYNQDLSLTEIAELAGVSRQGVSDALHRTERTLLELEAVTGCVRKTQTAAELRKIAAEVAALAGGKPLAERIASACGKLED